MIETSRVPSWVDLDADTISDEQIRELHGDALDSGDRATAKLTQVALGTWAGAHHWTAARPDNTIACAHYGANGRRCLEGYSSDVHIADARARCAEILNARAKETK